MEVTSNYDLQVDVAKTIFLDYDQELLARKFSLEKDEAYLYLTYLHTPCRIHRHTGGIEERIAGRWQECRDYGRVMTIYDLLCHHKGMTPPEMAGQWCAVGNFIVTGITKTEKFTGKYASCFQDRLPALKAACESLGGILQPQMAGADVTCLFPVTSFFSVLLQYWEGDGEFPPKLLILWDRNTMQFMHFETTFYLQGDLLQRLKDRIK